MKKLKIIAAAIAALTIGAAAYADKAAEDYLSKFGSLVTSVESSAKNKDGSKAQSFAAQKKDVDALRQTVTLSTTQRFSDWLLTKRYDMAYSKVQTAASGGSNGIKAKVGDALGDAASSVGGALKESGSQAVNTVKDSVKEAADDVKDAAKQKVDESISEAAAGISGKIQQGAESLTKKLNNFLNKNDSGNKD